MSNVIRIIDDIFIDHHLSNDICKKPIYFIINQSKVRKSVGMIIYGMKPNIIL